MAQVAAGRRSVGSKLKASRTSAGDQLLRTQSTEALLGELFQGLLQQQPQKQQRRRSSGGPGARSESRGEKAAETALVAGVDAEITKVKRLHMLNVHCLPICIISVWSILVLKDYFSGLDRA